MEETICRLCLNLIKNEFEVVDAATKEMLELLSLKVDLDASENPIFCQSCVDLIKKFYFFKSACMDMEELIISYSTAEEKAKIDIKDVYEDSKGVVEDGSSICRFCMNQIIASNCVSLDKLMKDEMYVEMLSTFMPEMVLDIIKDPVICTTCWKNLECYFKFTQNCCDTEEKINKYRQNEGSCSTNQIRLSNVLRFLSKDKRFQITEIKQESLLEDVEHTAEFEMQEDQIKCEKALDIKAKDVSLEGISCKNLLEVSVNKYDAYNLEENVKNNVEIGKEWLLEYETKHEDNTETRVDNSEVNNCPDALKVKMYTCTVCAFKTKYKWYLRRHVLSHKDTSEVQMYKCEICSHETRHKQYLKKHMLTHVHSSEAKMYKCGICTYETKYKSYLKRHMLTHKDAPKVEMYKCTICTFETKHKKNLQCHMLQHKDGSEVVMYKCETCTFETKYKSHLTTHMLKHKDKSEVEMHKCGICTFETKYKNHIKSHVLTHKDSSEVEMHKCEMCTYETKHKYNLTKHKLTHKGASEKMYKCGICTYEARYRNQLIKHVVIHKDSSEVKMHKCGKCTFESRHRDSLKRHLLIHEDASELEMHKCQMCTFETKYKGCLRRHLLVHKKYMVEDGR